MVAFGIFHQPFAERIESRLLQTSDMVGCLAVGIDLRHLVEADKVVFKVSDFGIFSPKVGQLELRQEDLGLLRDLV